MSHSLWPGLQVGAYSFTIAARSWQHFWKSKSKQKSTKMTIRTATVCSVLLDWIYWYVRFHQKCVFCIFYLKHLFSCLEKWKCFSLPPPPLRDNKFLKVTERKSKKQMEENEAYFCRFCWLQSHFPLEKHIKRIFHMNYNKINYSQLLF